MEKNISCVVPKEEIFLIFYLFFLLSYISNSYAIKKYGLWSRDQSDMSKCNRGPKWVKWVGCDDADGKIPHKMKVK